MSQKTGTDVEDLPSDIYFEYEEGEEEDEYYLEEEQPEVFYSEDFISRPVISEQGTIPEDILDFEYPLLDNRLLI